MNKRKIRLKYKSKRSSLTESERDEDSINIANNCLKLPIWELSNYHIFLPIEDKIEVNTEFLLHILHGKDKTIVVPKVLDKSVEMAHLLLQDNTSLRVSNYGVPEPVSGIEIPPSQIDVVFVPLLAFDELGNRVGYGKGYYDRFLTTCRGDTIFIGLSFFTPEAIIPFEKTDIPLNFCVTPHKIYTFKNNFIK